MPDLPNILARSGEDDLMKIIFGIGAVIVWGIVQMIAAVAKKAEDAKRRRQYGRLPEDVAVRNRAGIPTPPPVPSQQRPKQPKSKGKRRPVPALPVAATASSATYASATPQHAAVVEGPKGRAKQAGDAAPANRVGRLVRQPGTLRAAFILNEVLSKPLALRDTPNAHP
jgi:hypothetical protein